MWMHGVSTMQGCHCQHVLGDPWTTRKWIRKDPYSHAHITEVINADTLVYDAIHKDTHRTVYARDAWYAIYRCGDMYIGATRGSSLNTTVWMCPVGLPMWVSSYNMIVETATRLCTDTESLWTMQVTSCNIATWAARTFGAGRPEYVHAIRTRTGAYMSLHGVDVVGSSFVSLAGVVPPIRHEFGGASCTMTKRYMVTYVSRHRTRKRRRDTCACRYARRYARVIQWDITARQTRRLRLQHGFEVNHHGHVVAANCNLVNW